ncbi:hypothetical protein [Pedobacter glucosidilyticus]|nr:hypothetical protein [Pedobacter glucosidilyticus]
MKKQQFMIHSYDGFLIAIVLLVIIVFYFSPFELRIEEEED